MSALTRTDETRTSNNSQITTSQAAARSQTTANQPELDQHQEISRWSPNSSSLAPSTAGGGPHGTQRSTGASAADSRIAARGSIASSTTSNITNTDNVEAERERARFVLEHGGLSAPGSERAAERYTSAVTQDPQGAQQLSSSGRRAQERRKE